MSLGVLILLELLVSRAREGCSTIFNSAKKETQGRESGTIQILEIFLFS